MALEPKILPYIVVDNKAYVHKMNLGFSVAQELKQFSLAERQIVKDNIELTLPLGLLDFIKHLFPKECLRYTQGNHQVPTHETFNYPQLYGYQKTAVTNMLPFRNGILEAETGSGKTAMGLALALLKGKSILWINDRIELCRQARQTAIKLFNLPEEDCGLLQGDNEHVKKYTFTTIQKISKVLNFGFNDSTQSLIKFDTIIIDECHHCIGSFNDYKQYFQTLNELNYKHVYGLTATPKRVDGNESLVYAIIGPVRFKVIEQTKKMKAVVYREKFNIETTKKTYETFLNRYTQKAMPHKLDEHTLFNEQYLNFCKGYIDKVIAGYNKVLIVSPRVQGAKDISEYLTSKKIDHFLAHGAIKKRESLYTTKVLVATLDLVKEGFDMPDLEAVIVMSRKLHKLVETQIIGRSERYHPTKKQPVVYFLTPNIAVSKPESWDEMKKGNWRQMDLGEV
jgi:superfamily II DNA or RNA helicase